MILEDKILTKRVSYHWPTADVLTEAHAHTPTIHIYIYIYCFLLSADVREI